MVKTEEKIVQDGETKTASRRSSVSKEEESKSESRRSSVTEDKKKKVLFGFLKTCYQCALYNFQRNTKIF